MYNEVLDIKEVYSILEIGKNETAKYFIVGIAKFNTLQNVYNTTIMLFIYGINQLHA